MSDTDNKGAEEIKAAEAADQPTIPDPADAYNHLFSQVHARVFFNKLASYGYVAETPKQQASLLELAGKLRMVEESPEVKKAQDEVDLYAQANTALDHVLEETGLNGHMKTAEAKQEEDDISIAAQYLMNDPSIYNSVLSLKTAEAAYLAGALQS